MRYNWSAILTFLGYDGDVIKYNNNILLLMGRRNLKHHSSNVHKTVRYMSRSYIHESKGEYFVL